MTEPVGPRVDRNLPDRHNPAAGLGIRQTLARQRVAAGCTVAVVGRQVVVAMVVAACEYPQKVAIRPG